MIKAYVIQIKTSVKQQLGSFLNQLAFVHKNNAQMVLLGWSIDEDFHVILRIKIESPWCEIAKNKAAKITCTYYGDKSKKLAPLEKTSYTVCPSGAKFRFIFPIDAKPKQVSKGFKYIKWKKHWAQERFDLDLWTLYRDHLLIGCKPCTKFGIDQVKG